MTTARVLHTATLLPSGRVLVAGGYKSPNLLSSAETYNPATGSWSTVASMDSPRSLHTATLLPSGRVLVAGGGLVSTFIASAELYEPDPDSTGPQPGGGTQPSGGGTQPSGGGTQPSGGEGVRPIPDTSPAVVATSVRAQKLAAVLKKGLALTVTANEAAALRVELLLDRRVATRLGLRARIGTATVRIFAAGKVAVKVKLSRTARRKLAAQRRVRLKVSVRATDAAGNQTVRTRTVTLRR